MRRVKVRAILLTGVLLTAPAAVQSQSPEVYRIVSSNCSGPNQRPRVQTGFREAGQPGMVTTLHGVVGCNSIRAVRTTTPVVGYDLKIAKVDIESDLALLTGNEFDASALSGFASSAQPVGPNTDLQVIGFPQAIPKPLVSDVRSRERPYVQLIELLPVGQIRGGALSSRNSPAPRTQVMSIEGHLTVGHSGAPVLNARNEVVGVADGGLENGAVEISWAIPYRNRQRFVDESKVTDALKHLALLDPESLFAFAWDTPEYPPISCFGRSLDFIRLVGLNELMATMDDPMTYEQLVHMYQLDDAHEAFQIYRDKDSEVTIVVPFGWDVNAVGGRCTAEAPLPRALNTTQPAIVFSVDSVSGSDVVQAITFKVQAIQFDNFFAKGFVVNPTASNWMPVFAAQRGTLAQRVSYFQVQRFCSLTRYGYEPLETFRNRSDVTPFSGPLNAQCGGEGRGYTFPDLWMNPYAPPQYPPDYQTGVGFASLTASNRLLLVSRIAVTGTRIGVDFSYCLYRLSLDADCQASFLGYKRFGLAVIAATASTITRLKDE